MRTASAQVVAQRFQHFGLRGVRRPHQQRLDGHYHAVEAVAALRGLFPDEGDLYRIGMIARAKSLEGQNLTLDAAADRDHAGTRCDAIDQHGARSTFAKPAAELWSVQFKIVAQHVKQRGIGGRLDMMDAAVHRQANRLLRHWLVPAPAFALQ